MMGMSAVNVAHDPRPSCFCNNTTASEFQCWVTHDDLVQWEISVEVELWVFVLTVVVVREAPPRKGYCPL